MGCCSAKLNAEGNYDPSCFTLCMATSSKSDYESINYDHHASRLSSDIKQTSDGGSEGNALNGQGKYTGTKPILVVCTDEGLMTMANGKTFSTGNHPVEMLVPMLHFRDAGFNFDIATVNGNPVVLEMWAYPTKDEHVISLHNEVKTMMQSPKKLDDIPNLDAYSAIFIPGGHGCMINLPTSVALGKLLNIAHARALPTVTLCHGPSTFLSTCLEGTGSTECAYKGYRSMCFTDKTDAMTPKIGYLPGPMPWKVEESIVEKGVVIVNTKETGAVTSDRELITGDSPTAANNLGKLAAPLLVKYAVEQNL